MDRVQNPFLLKSSGLRSRSLNKTPLEEAALQTRSDGIDCSRLACVKDLLLLDTALVTFANTANSDIICEGSQ